MKKYRVPHQLFGDECMVEVTKEQYEHYHEHQKQIKANKKAGSKEEV